MCLDSTFFSPQRQSLLAKCSNSVSPRLDYFQVCHISSDSSLDSCSAESVTKSDRRISWLWRIFESLFVCFVSDIIIIIRLINAYILLCNSIVNYFTFLIAHVIPGLLLAVICYIGNHPYACVALITFSLGFNGAATITNLQNAQDLAPNYAGSLYGIVNFFATTSGFISPAVVGYFTAEQVSIRYNRFFNVWHYAVNWW